MKTTVTITTPGIREFNLAYEVDKLKKLLQLPITNIVFDERYEYGKLYLDDDDMALTTIYAKLYINDEMIGTIPYMSDRWGPMYDNNEPDEQLWNKAYQRFEDVILDKILQQEPLAAAVEMKKYGMLNVKDKDGTIINTAYCNYIDDKWNVMVAGVSPVERRIVARIELVPPRPHP